MDVAIFDLDGCIADDRRRRRLLPERGTCDQDYAAYHADCGADPVANNAMVERHNDAGHRLVFITSRPQVYRADTHKWLARNFPGMEGMTVLARPDRDNRPSKELKPALYAQHISQPWSSVVAAYDDRDDVLDAYRAHGARGCQKLLAGPSVAGILREMAATFEERNAQYGDNYRRVAPIMRILFPDGVPPELLGTDQWHLFELKVVKLTRFAISNLTHIDSVHDDAVYSAMIEKILWEKTNEHD